MNHAWDPSCTALEHAPSPRDGGIGIYFPCPDCGIYFKSTPGFADHMTVEHEWRRQNAATYWDRQPALQSA